MTFRLGSKLHQPIKVLISHNGTNNVGSNLIQNIFFRLKIKSTKLLFLKYKSKGGWCTENSDTSTSVRDVDPTYVSARTTKSGGPRQ